MIGSQLWHGSHSTSNEVCKNICLDLNKKVALNAILVIHIRN